jgi:arsenite methyltransferase
MNRVGTLVAFGREIFSKRTLPREPEPDPIMEDEHQVAAYAEAGRIDGVMGASYLFHSAHISQTIVGCERVLDLGCGTATQLAQIAQLNPQTAFLGMDLSEKMLGNARRHVASLGLSNVEFIHGDISRLNGLEDASFDGIICTMALHHLPAEEDLRRCFQEITRVLKQDGALYLVDFGRLKSLKSVIFFAYMNRANDPHLFSLDYERSMRAAFLHEDFVCLAGEELPPHVEVYSTFMAALLILLKTPDRAPLTEKQKARVVAIEDRIEHRYQSILTDIRRLVRWGGFKGNDPFA